MPPIFFLLKTSKIPWWAKLLICAASTTLVSLFCYFTKIEAPNSVFLLALDILLALFDYYGAFALAGYIPYILYFYASPKGSFAYDAPSLAVVVTVSIVAPTMVAIVGSLSFIAKKSRARLEEAADLDPLTNMFNRRGFDKAIQKMLKSHKQEGSLVMMDLDDFKRLNDVYGHEAGDIALIYIASQIQKDAGGSAIVGRNGGDEFVAYIPKVGKEVEDLLSRFVNARHVVNVNGQEVEFKASVGYCYYPLQAKDYRELCRKADAALYVAKSHGKGEAVCYRDGMGEAARLEMGFNLKDIANNIPGGMLIYKNNEKGDILFANEELIKMFGCESFADFLSTYKGSFNNLIDEEDREAILISIQNQIKNSSTNSDAVNYRILKKDGSKGYAQEFGHLAHSPYYGEIFYVFFQPEKEQ